MTVYKVYVSNIVQAMIHLESILSVPKQMDVLESLVDKYLQLSPESPNDATASEKEELSCIFLEVCNAQFEQGVTFKLSPYVCSFNSTSQIIDSLMLDFRWEFYA